MNEAFDEDSFRAIRDVQQMGKCQAALALHEPEYRRNVGVFFKSMH
jgi:hypothetical protein